MELVQATVGSEAYVEIDRIKSDFMGNRRPLSGVARAADGVDRAKLLRAGGFFPSGLDATPY